LTLLLMQGLITGWWGIASGGSMFPLAKLVEDGPAVDYLRDECPRRHFRLCDYLGEMPMSSSDMFWSENSVMMRIGGPLALAGDAPTIIWGALRRQPARSLNQALANTLAQLKIYAGGWEPIVRLTRYGAADELSPAVRRRFPAEYPDYLV